MSDNKTKQAAKQAAKEDKPTGTTSRVPSDPIRLEAVRVQRVQDKVDRITQAVSDNASSSLRVSLLRYKSIGKPRCLAAIQAVRQACDDAEASVQAAFGSGIEGQKSRVNLGAVAGPTVQAPTPATPATVKPIVAIVAPSSPPA